MDKIGRYELQNVDGTLMIIDRLGYVPALACPAGSSWEAAGALLKARNERAAAAAADNLAPRFSAADLADDRAVLVLTVAAPGHDAEPAGAAAPARCFDRSERMSRAHAAALIALMSLTVWLTVIAALLAFPWIGGAVWGASTAAFIFLFQGRS